MGPHGTRTGPRRSSRGATPNAGTSARPGGWQHADLAPADDAADWFAGRLPSGWFTGAPDVRVDREEIVVVGELPPVEGASEEGAAAAASGRISRWREDTREERMRIADEAEARYGRKVAWGARLGEHSALFTHLAVPVMTRLRQPQRQVLDTLVDAGVARSRSEALAWAVTLVGQHTEEWLRGLREAMAEVDKLRAEGPQL
jgi:Arc/MetJ-type ribon-helix-helix transcriptional regulator